MMVANLSSIEPSASDATPLKHTPSPRQSRTRAALAGATFLLAGLLAACGTMPEPAFNRAAADCPVAARQSSPQPGDTMVLLTTQCARPGHVSAFGSWLPAGADHF